MGIILDCEEMAENRRGKISLDGVQREYVRCFRVITSEPFAPALQVKLANLGPANRIPRWGEPYIAGGWYDYGALCIDIEADQPEKDDPTFWLVKATYKSRSGNPDSQQQGGGGGSGDSPQNTHPIFSKPQVTWATKKVLRPIIRDIEGKPITNSAGTPFEVQTKEVHLQHLTIIRNELQFLPFSTNIYKGRVNSTLFQRTRPGYALCDDIRHQTKFGDGVDYAEVTYEFTFEDDQDPEVTHPWQLALVDKGPKYRDPDTNAIKDFVGSTGMAGNEIFLDGFTTIIGTPTIYGGYPHPDFNVATGELSPAAVAKIKYFKVRKEIDFDELGLPDPAWF